MMPALKIAVPSHRAATTAMSRPSCAKPNMSSTDLCIRAASDVLAHFAMIGSTCGRVVDAGPSFASLRVTYNGARPLTAAWRVDVQAAWMCAVEIIPLEEANTEGVLLSWPSPSAVPKGRLPMAPSPASDQGVYLDESSNSSFTSSCESCSDGDVLLSPSTPPKYRLSRSGGRPNLVNPHLEHAAWRPTTEPTRRVGTWSDADDKILFDAHSRIVLGPIGSGGGRGKWAQVAALFPGKSESAVKNRWFRRFSAPRAQHVSMTTPKTSRRSDAGKISLSPLVAGMHAEQAAHTPQKVATDWDAPPQTTAADRADTPSTSPPPTESPQPPYMRWTPSQDVRLRKLVQQFGGKQWRTVAHLVGAIGPNETAPTAVQALHRWKKVLDPCITKGAWTPEEDCILLEAVRFFRKNLKWRHVATRLPGRLGKQCRERYQNHLDPSVSKDKFSDAEIGLAIRLHDKLGNKWAEIARWMPGRTDNAVKNMCNGLIRRRCWDAYRACEERSLDVLIEVVKDEAAARTRRQTASLTSLSRFGTAELVRWSPSTASPDHGAEADGELDDDFSNDEDDDIWKSTRMTLHLTPPVGSPVRTSMTTTPTLDNAAIMHVESTLPSADSMLEPTSDKSRATLDHLIAAAQTVLAESPSDADNFHVITPTDTAAQPTQPAKRVVNRRGTYECDLCGYVTKHRGHYNRHRTGQSGGTPGGCEAKHGLLRTKGGKLVSLPRRSDMARCNSTPEQYLTATTALQNVATAEVAATMCSDLTTLRFHSRASDSYGAGNRR
eukprot:CAMPEP_0206290344 /NCGR_PEP_ID=MMETSP0106_2-20121207/2572_1 /ASSEMBLY_ACC=CAM_ASM_000206 /TAXON_ID=81532 /ORGANISM="Acanthoeca-like sp., Strain 10tr" /LENGTH=776 /DNA_ID=CAMNT_0053720903 /DNA_START=117 /DNA_END=2444 /DNA_ORIENTATION=-